MTALCSIFTAVASAVALVTLGACASDGPAGTPATQVSETKPADDGLDPSSVRVYTSAEVCDLASAAVIEQALGADVVEADPQDFGTPQCSYNFTLASGTFTNLTLAVQRPIEDLGGAAGSEGFDRATSIVVFDAPYVDYPGLGDRAAVSKSENLTLLAVLAKNQVFTVATSAPVTAEQVAQVALAVVANL